MRIFAFVIIILLFSCENQSKRKDLETTHQIEIGNKKYHTNEDIVLIISRYDTIKYTKFDYNKIVDSNPEFFEEYPQDPYLLYACKNDYLQFGSEAGQDEYFVLYQHFLMLRNGIKEYEQERRNLIEIYSAINSLFGWLRYGGTYFGHQDLRISGYAEYSVYLYKSSKDEINESFSIKKQKELFVESLHQMIKDEVEIDSNTIGEEKRLRMEELCQIVNVLDRHIINIFYLRRAQEFLHSHYEYYNF